jgi:hypothetical protein
MIYFHTSLELAFFRKANFRYFTSPDHIFIINNWDNCPPFVSLSIDRSNTPDRGDVMWNIYYEGKVDHERLLGLCLLMLGMHVEKDEDITMVAKGFSNRIIETKVIFDPYRELSIRQLDYLMRMAREKLSRKYFVLSYCKNGIDIIQDIQKETAGMHLFQFRHEDLEKF